MKKNLRFFAISGLCLLLLPMFSCSNLTEEGAPAVEAAEQCVLRISFDTVARTVLPTVSETQMQLFKNIQLFGTRKDGDPMVYLHQSFETVDLMNNASLVVEPGVWHFSLTAHLDDITFFGEIAEQTIEVGKENTLSFALDVVQAGASGDTGTLSITLQFPKDKGVKVVRSGLFSVEDDSPVTTLKAVRPDDNGDTMTITYDNAEAPVGIYRFKAFLYGDTNYIACINTYREIVSIAANCTSSATRTIEYLNEVHSVAFEKNGGAFASGYLVPEVYTRNASLPLANAGEITKAGYVFVGWYEKPDYTGERFTKIVPGSVGEKTFYAKWAEGEVVTASTMASLSLSNKNAGYTVAVVGDVTPATLSALVAKLKVASNSVTVDLTAATVVSLSNGLFKGCNKIAAILLPENLTTIGSEVLHGTAVSAVTIPASVTSIGQNAFGSCSSLTSIAVSADNTAYKSVDGVLFTSDGKTMVQYPAGKTDTAYTIPEGTVSVNGGAFIGAQNISTLTIASTTTAIAADAFNDCTGLTAFAVTGTNPMYRIYDDNGILCNVGGYTLVRYPAGKTETSFTLPSLVTAIGNYAFQGNTHLTQILTTNSDLTTIGSYAFSGCSALATFAVPDGVTRVGEYAFSGTKLNLDYVQVSFETNDADALEGCSVKKNASFTLPSGLVRKGYTFDGWYTTASYTGSALESTTTVSQNTTFYAKWSPITHTITYELNGGTNNTTNPSSYTIESGTITLAAPTQTGYTFMGWYTTENFAASSKVDTIDSGALTSDVTLYAQWSVITYTITYHVSEKGVMPSTYTTSYTVNSSTIDLPIPTATASRYTFSGWYTSYDESSDTLSGITTSIAASSAQDIELWAGWSTSVTRTLSWSRLSIGSYYFTGNSATHVWTSNNAGVGSSTATTSWTISVGDTTTVTIPYTVSSESGYDKLTITLDSTTVISGVSGTANSSFTRTLSAGSHTLTAKYEKDGSVNSGSDTATVTLSDIVGTIAVVVY